MKSFDVQLSADLLKDWVVFSQRHLYKCKERPELVSYGVGEHVSWGVQSHQKAFSAFVIAALSDEIDWSDTPLSKEMVLSQAIGMLRYNLASHLVGDYHCIDGGKWGNTWISALGIERMFHAIDALKDYLTPKDKENLRNMMLSEADFLVAEYPVVAGLVENNKPESNIWNGALLYRTAAMYPDAPNKDLYIEKAQRFFVNGISLPSDENSDEMCDGVRIGDLFVGANMFESFSCNHHGYLNVGYMVICLSNIAMLHFGLKNLNSDAPKMIYRHAKELWELVRSFIYRDGRLLRIGGDTRARYCYCQDYALPVWAFAEEFFGDNCQSFINGWFEILRRESHFNGDGSFLSARMGQFENRSPLYYTRLESDRANVVSMMLYWHKKFSSDPKNVIQTKNSWSDEYHGAAFSSNGNRYASFVWRSAELPQGLLVPKDDSSLAEWRYNLSGRVIGTGLTNFDEYEKSEVRMFSGGFITFGSTLATSDDHLAENQPKEYIARKKIAFAALPDENTVLCLQEAKATGRVFVAESKGLFWNIPNDIYNKQERTIYHEYGNDYIRGGVFAKEFKVISLGNFVNADNKIGVASLKPMMLVRNPRRQVDIKGKDMTGSLYAEEVCTEYVSTPRWYEDGDRIFDTGFAASLGSSEETEKMSKSLFSLENTELHTIGITAKDGRKYVLVANFTDEDKIFEMSAKDVSTGMTVTNTRLASGKATLLEI
ncbi:MAG: hypothetical protein IJO61_03950 [Oscillospiraceae bacterium]|nr:hypothetical protein [Oscillospiraceae bacterium]